MFAGFVYSFATKAGIDWQWTKNGSMWVFVFKHIPLLKSRTVIVSGCVNSEDSFAEYGFLMETDFKCFTSIHIWLDQQTHITSYEFLSYSSSSHIVTEHAHSFGQQSEESDVPTEPPPTNHPPIPYTVIAVARNSTFQSNSYKHIRWTVWSTIRWPVVYNHH